MKLLHYLTNLTYKNIRIMQTEIILISTSKIMDFSVRRNVEQEFKLGGFSAR